MLQAEGGEPELPRVLAGPEGHPQAGRRCHLRRGSYRKSQMYKIIKNYPGTLQVFLSVRNTEIRQMH